MDSWYLTLEEARKLRPMIDKLLLEHPKYEDLYVDDQDPVEIFFSDTDVRAFPEGVGWTYMGMEIVSEQAPDEPVYSLFQWGNLPDWVEGIMEEIVSKATELTGREILCDIF